MDNKNQSSESSCSTTSISEDKESIEQLCSAVKDVELQEKYLGEFKCKFILREYFPSRRIKLAQIKNFREELLVRYNPVLQKYLICRDLQPDCIKQVLDTLLEIEDAHTMLPYCSLYQHQVQVHQVDSLRLTFDMVVPKNVNIDDVLSFKSDEVVFVPKESAALKELQYPIDLLMIHPAEDKSSDDDIRRHKRILEKVEKKHVTVKKPNQKNKTKPKKPDQKNKTKPKISDFDLEKRYDIIFRPNRFSFCVQHRALELLENERFEFIFPSNNLPAVETPNTSLEIINKLISGNPEQLQAVQRIFDGGNPHAPYIVFGPPGTGKTTTIVEAILQLYILAPNCHILITTGSNSACDTVALKLCEYFEKCPQIIQLSQQRRERNLLGNPEPPTDILRIYSKSWIEKIGYKNINPLIKKYANFQLGEVVFPSIAVIRKYKLIFTTLCNVGIMRTGVYGPLHFTHVFIDEAAAIKETEALVAISSVNTKTCRVIMSGDTKQLGPVVMSRVAADLGLKQSLMERLLARDCYADKADGTYDTTLQTRLRRNYRSHPEILRLFNHLYYKGELIAEVKADSIMHWNELKILANKNFPIIFEAVHGKTDHSKNSQSSYNQAEVNKVVWIVHQLQKHVDDLSKIGIISPYRLQCAKIKQMLRRRKLHDIEVGTAELYQGREKQIIIASFVKSFIRLGFLANPQRLNVILSRAQSLLILVGNPLSLKTNADFNYLIEECKTMGTFHKCN